MEFPFIFGPIVTGRQFIDRKKELVKLRNNIDHGVHTILISPRRWGKSSLVHHLSRKLSKDKSIKWVYIDPFGLSDELEFFEEYSKAMLKVASSKLDDPGKLIHKFFRNIQPSITIGKDPKGDFKITLQKADMEKGFEEILDLPEKLALKKRKKLIICIDEFQYIERFKNPLLFQSRLGSVWQNHKEVIYILCGSKPHRMEKIFNTEGNPFFRLGDVIYLSKIKKKHFRRFIISTFERSGKTIPKERADKLIEIVGKNPYFVQQLARQVWIKRSEMVIESDIRDAVDEIIQQNSIWYFREVERMTGPQFNYLKAVVNREPNLSGQEVLRKYKLGSSANVAKIKLVMEEREILNYKNLYPEFLDPFLKLWIKENFT